jgi:hypothetical protein
MPKNEKSQSGRAFASAMAVGSRTGAVKGQSHVSIVSNGERTEIKGDKNGDIKLGNITIGGKKQRTKGK